MHQSKRNLYGFEQASGCISLYVNANKTEYVCFKQKGAVSTLSGKPLKLEDQFTYLGSNISSDESDAKAWNAMDRLLIAWKFDL